MRDVRGVFAGLFGSLAIALASVVLVIASRRRGPARRDVASRPARRARADRGVVVVGRRRRSSRSTSCSSSSTGSSSRPARTCSTRRRTGWSSSSRSSSGRRRRSPSGSSHRHRAARAAVAARWRRDDRARRAAAASRRADRGAATGPMSRPPTHVEEARDAVLAAIAGPAGHGAPSRSADVLGPRRWRRPVVSLTALPPWDNSAMDGYAIRAADVARRDRGRRRPRSRSSARSGRRGARRHGPARHGDPDRDRRAAPAGRRRGRPGRATTPIDAGGRPGTARPRRDGPAAGRDPRPRGGAGRAARSADAGSDLADGTTILEPGTAMTAGRRRARSRARASTTSWSTGGRASRVLATGDEVGAPGQALGPAGIPDANGPGLAALVEAAGGEADRPRHRARPTRRRPGPARARPRRRRRTRSSCPAASRSGRTTSSGRRSRRSARSSCGGSRSSPASRSRSGRATPGEGRCRRPCCSACPGTRSRRFVTFELFVRPAMRRLGGRRDDDFCDRSIEPSSARP